MKRMSEVFELPLSYVDVAEATVNLTVDEVFHIRAAVNHVDALADALDECLDDMELEGKHNDRVYKLAKLALASYRGEK